MRLWLNFLRIPCRKIKSASFAVRCRAVEGGKQTIACGVYLVAAERGQFFAQHRVVVAEHLAPPRVAQFGSAFGGPNNVSEHDGGEHPVRFEKSVCASYELLDLVCNEILRLLIEH
jgi:hypothetical protein